MECRPPPHKPRGGGVFFVLEQKKDKNICFMGYHRPSQIARLWKNDAQVYIKVYI